MKSFLSFFACLLASTNLLGQVNMNKYYALMDSVDRWQEEHILYQAAPQFKAQLMSGEKFDLAEQRGQVVFLNFWFTTCFRVHKEDDGRILRNSLF